ncbi:MAG TPA: hypothetical protein VN873_06695 [Candidatus Angelobacter sp.]|nr:hypothetical protein [Candidatus Angelobacter sp.]
MIKMLIPQKPLTQSRALYCFVINQLATPGLGSLLGGRPLAGAGQLSLAILGCLTMMIWFFQTMKAYYGTMVGDTAPPGNIHFLIAGALIFGVSWFWSLATSISLIRETSVKPPENPSATPPRITNPPPKM